MVIREWHEKKYVTNVDIEDGLKLKLGVMWEGWQTFYDLCYYLTPSS